jgi:uncharacterized protein YlaI
MITTKTQCKSKQTYLYAYLHTYLYLVYPVYFVKNNSSSSSVPSVAKNRILQNKPNFKTTYLCNLRNLWFQFMPNEPNLISQFFILNSQFRSPRLRNKPNSTFLNPCIPASMYSCCSPNEPNFIPSYPSVPSVAKNRILQNKPNFKTTYLCNLCNLWFQFMPNEPNFKKYTENVNICGSKDPPPTYLLIVTSG